MSQDTSNGVTQRRSQAFKVPERMPFALASAQTRVSRQKSSKRADFADFCRPRSSYGRPCQSQ